ncbi:type IV secretion system protein [Antribacter sp. KLBMP9083]|uniref:Type IV secretion system protein n=2 Tax=Antribacter soli TaxID=2910976 RepID=A0AA41U9C3_9MICO|nr:type IV secretion system protein [Antribacter soli]MCF4123661.1 type IV secretion system protein [Antribacter soli]
MTDMPCNDPITAAVCQQASDQAPSIAEGVLEGLAEIMGNTAAWLITNLWTVLEATTMVDLTGDRFTSVHSLVFGIAVFLMLAFFLLQLITGMLRREPGALGRAVGGLAKSVLGSFVVVTLTGTLLEITDQVCLSLVAAASTTMEDLGRDLAFVGTSTVLATAIPGVGPLLALFLAGMAIAAAFILWLSLLVRSALLLITIALAPLALAGSSWDATRGWVSRWAQFVVALIVSKLVIVVVFLLATSLITTPIAGDLAVWSEKLTAVVLLAVAAFAPYLTYKAISFMGFDMYHAMSIEQETKAALNRPVPLAAGSAVAGGFVGRNVPKVLGPDGRSAGSAARSGSGATGASAGGAAGAGAAGSAATVAAPVILGAQLVKAAATAGPKAGAAVGGMVGQQAGAAAQTAAPRAGGAAPTHRAPSGPPVRDVPTVFRDAGERS